MVVALVMGATTTLRDQIGVQGMVNNCSYTIAPAQSAMWKIRNALLSAIQNPAGVNNTLAPIYSVSAQNSLAGQYSSMTWRPLIGYIAPGTTSYTYTSIDGTTYTNSYATFSGNGQISTNNILYDNAAYKLWVDTVDYPGVNVLRLDVVKGATGGTLVRSQILVGYGVTTKQTVAEFRLFNAESTDPFNWNATPTPALGATNNTYLMGIYLRVEHPSVVAADKGAISTSNLDNSQNVYEDLRMAVLIPPETLSNSVGKPFVGP
jgi:hypothetical protein